MVNSLLALLIDNNSIFHGLVVVIPNSSYSYSTSSYALTKPSLDLIIIIRLSDQYLIIFGGNLVDNMRI